LPREKHSAKKFFIESQQIGSRQRILCLVFFFAESFFSLGKEASLTRVFSLPGVFDFTLDKAFFTESFLFGSRARTAL
jgi:hypothetical protein